MDIERVLRNLNADDRWVTRVSSKEIELATAAEVMKQCRRRRALRSGKHLRTGATRSSGTLAGKVNSGKATNCAGSECGLESQIVRDVQWGKR